MTKPKDSKEAAAALRALIKAQPPETAKRLRELVKAKLGKE